MFQITEHKLTGGGAKYKESPNKGDAIEPKYLVMHYTAGSSATSSIDTLTNRTSKASAHLVIGRDGSVTQLVPFNVKAWHAGESRWRGFYGLNTHSIGIELDNAGRLSHQGANWTSWFSRVYPDADVFVGAHKHEDEATGWHRYTPEQIERTIEIAQLLVDEYELLDVVGHDDIAPGRKSDPGPAFPLDTFRGQVMGRSEDEELLHRATSTLNIRGGPGTAFEKISDTPLAPDTVMRILSSDCNWCFVEVLESEGQPRLSGWVYGDYIHPILA